MADVGQPKDEHMANASWEDENFENDEVEVSVLIAVLTLLTLLPPPMGVKMQHTCAEIDYSSPDQVTILSMPNELTCRLSA
jgi:hypothetical protein